MSDYLPPELWPEIFLKLPIISVMQCTAVCKQWRSIITSSTFVSDHLHLSRQNPLLLQVKNTASHNTFSLHFDTESDSPPRLSQTLSCPFQTRHNRPFRVVGSVDGIVLLFDDIGYHSSTYYSIILWNPSIRKSFTLPKPRFSWDRVDECHYVMLGFGLDSAIGDYKVVRLVYIVLETKSSVKMPLMAEVYSLRDRIWRTVKCPHDDDQLMMQGNWCSCFIHGATHWIRRLKTVQGQEFYHHDILLFDLGTEKFKTMAVPEPEIADTYYFMFVIGGLLSVSHLRADWNYETYNPCIWVKKDYYADSWTKIVSLDVRKQQVGEWLNLRSVCVKIPSGGDCKDIQVHHVDNFKQEDPFVLGHILFNYTESLILLNEGTTVQEAT